MTQKLGWHTLDTSFDCPCGVAHALPIQVCYSGTDASQRMAAFARKRCGHTCLLVSDENTRRAAPEWLAA